MLSIVIGLVGALLTVLAWLNPKEPASSPARPEIYALRVQVLDPAGQPVQGSTVRVSSGHEPHLLPDGWWQIEIPAAKVPTDGKVTLWAEHPQWRGTRLALALRDEPNPQAEIRLEIPTSQIRGVVVDAAGRGVSGARVSVRNAAGASAVSDQDGTFTLQVTAAQHERVRLHVEHNGFLPKASYCLAGHSACSIVLAGAP